MTHTLSIMMYYFLFMNILCRTMFHTYRHILWEALAIIGIFFGIGLILLLITGSEWPFVQQKTSYYGPYNCKNMSVVLRTNENIRRLEWVHTMKLDLLVNGVKINTDDYNPEAIGYARPLPWSWKCEPIVVTEKRETIDTIIDCLEPIIKKEILKKSIEEKEGTPFQLCGIAQFDTTFK